MVGYIAGYPNDYKLTFTKPVLISQVFHGTPLSPAAGLGLLVDGHEEVVVAGRIFTWDLIMFSMLQSCNCLNSVKKDEDWLYISYI